MFHRFNLLVLLAAAVITGSDVQAQSNRENDVIIDQIGRDNSAIISQSGQRNLAGSVLQTMVQDGIFNELSITQTGFGNSVGLLAPGLLQFGRLNTATVFNRITIIQNSDANVIGSILQSSEGAVTNGANTLSVTQQSGDRNRINAIIQIQDAGEEGQSAVITMTGSDNFIDRVEQRSNAVGRDGENDIQVTILGRNNGRIGLSGFAAEPLLADSSILQEGDGTVDLGIYGNKVVLEIIGDDTRFGLRQGGRMNDMGRLLVNGNSNQLGLRQDGTENNIQMAVIEGDSNEVGIDQIVTNVADVSLIGKSDDNRLYAFQQGTNMLTARIEGDLNTWRSRQDYLSGRGGANVATFSMLGDRNFADLEQLGSNLFDLIITGDRNNSGAALNGVAARGGLTAGYFSQRGSANGMTYTITGSDNIFAASQTGADNFIVALISGGFNQSALVQTGAGNIASLIQSGNGNNAGIYQN